VVGWRAGVVAIAIGCSVGMLERFDFFAAEVRGRDIVVSHSFVFDLLVVYDVVAVWSKCLLLGCWQEAEDIFRLADFVQIKLTALVLWRQTDRNLSLLPLSPNMALI
jgi:hypothetical protein